MRSSKVLIYLGRKLHFKNLHKQDRNFHKLTVSTACFTSKKKPLPIYAAYLYDSVMLYAKALAYVISTKNVNGELIIS